jgi:hypothetical protein
VNREYDVFERLPDGSALWRGVVVGMENARAKLQELARGTANELFATEIVTGEVVARIDTTLVREQKIKRVFQIAYDATLLAKRAEQLRACGYDVTSVLGNESAVSSLRLRQDYDLFIVGHERLKKLE